MTDRIGNRKSFGPLPGGGYLLDLIDEGVRVELRHVRRDSWHQVHAEVDVSCDWAGALRPDDKTKSISCADLNLSSQERREGRGKYCARRAQSRPEDFDWPGVIDLACRLTLDAERTSSGAIILDDAADAVESDFHVHGLRIPTDGASGFVADGGGLKSLMLLYVLGQRAQAGSPVLYLDNEWTATRHKTRKCRLFGTERIDNLFYWRLVAPLADELDRVRRFVDEHHIALIGVDSVSQAVDGKLTDDDAARAFLRTLSVLPPSICAAHIAKSQFGAEKTDVRPFGSAFFHNFLRASWVLKKQADSDGDVVIIGAFPSKQNDGPRAKAVGFEFSFTPERIFVRGVDLATVEGLADSLPLWLRMKHAVSRGPQTLATLADELGAKVETIDRTVRRKNGMFTRVPGTDGIARIALVETRQTA